MREMRGLMHMMTALAMTAGIAVAWTAIILAGTWILVAAGGSAPVRRRV